MKHGNFIDLDGLSTLKSRSSLKNYGYLFSTSLERLDENADQRANIIKGLTALGIAMTSKPSTADATIDATMTYLGQFIDHDMTLSAMKQELVKDIDQDIFDLVPKEELNNFIKNIRTGTNDIDSLYQTSAIDATGRFVLGNLVGEAGNNGNDLPRDPNAKALIGDPRNDENLAVAQTHVAFLKFHNAIMDKEKVDAVAARKIATQHYQWVILHDFLAQIADPVYLQQALMYGNRFFKPSVDDFFLPLEFTIAAYRLGHSMVRDQYNWSAAFPEATLLNLFTFSNSGNQVPPPAIWKIDWNNFVQNKAKKIDTAIVNPLADIPTSNFNLAARNLRRGYMFSLPTGQAVAQQILFDQAQILSAEELLEHATVEERAVLIEHNFHIKTPLWYYILKEAEIRTNGQRLGPIGSAIVIEVFIQTILLANFSILKEPSWKPSLGANFTFKDLLQYAELLNTSPT